MVHHKLQYPETMFPALKAHKKLTKLNATICYNNSLKVVSARYWFRKKRYHLVVMIRKTNQSADVSLCLIKNVVQQV